MPPLLSCRAKPSSKLLETKAPEATVTVPLMVTVLPSGRARASPIFIVLAASAGLGAIANTRLMHNMSENQTKSFLDVRNIVFSYVDGQTAVSCSYGET